MQRIDSADGMRGLGAQLAGILRVGDLVILEGPLGAGKTTLVQGIGAGLGVRTRITSPTFVIARVHPTAAGSSLVHVDAYRMSSLAEIDDLGIDEEIDDAITVVEWGKGAVDEWSEHPLSLQIERSLADGEDVREVRWEADREAWAQRWDRLTNLLGAPRG